MNMIKNIIVVLVTMLTIVTMPVPAFAWFQYSPEWEELNRDAFYQQTISEIGVSNDEEAQAVLRKQADLVLDAMRQPHEFVRITLTQQRGYNAFASYGRNVYISPALFNNFSSAERVAIVGHEFSHVLHQDVLTKTDKAAETKAYGTALFTIFAQGKSYQQQQQLSFGLTLLRTHILRGGLGREQENRADQEAWENVVVPLALQHKVNPGGQAASFARLKILLGSGETAGALGWLTSLTEPEEHSSTQKRLERSLENLKAFGKDRVEIRNETEIWIDGKFATKAEETQIGSRYIPASVNACLIMGRIAGAAHENKLPKGNINISKYLL